MREYNLLTFLDNHFSATQTLKSWYDESLLAMSQDDLDRYILDTYLMQLYNDQAKVNDIKTQYVNWLGAIAAQASMQAPNPQPQLIEQAVMQESVAVPNRVEYSEEAMGAIANQLTELVEPVEQTQIIPVEYQNDAISNLALIRELESTVMAQLNEIALLKEPFIHENNYVNDSYNYCPSFKNLIEPV